MAIEQNDPCERAKQLRALRDDIMLGRNVNEAEFEAGNGTRRRTKFGTANLAMLNQAIAEADAACDKLNGRCSRRFAIVPR
jgi:hypothetical protein